jgi:phosphoribosylglycinamide formyltransferase-1
MRIGIIGSSGGSAFAQAYRILRAVDGDAHGFCVITDRPCGLEDLCVSAGLKHSRIVEPDNRRFSTAARAVLDDFGGVDFVLLFFTRVVTRELFTLHATFNIHPSLLPAFRGLRPIERMLAARARFFGTTLHLVSEAIDGGPVVAQTVMPVTPGTSRAYIDKCAYIHKVYLTLLLVELMETGVLQLTPDLGDIRLRGEPPYTAWSNPTLCNPGYLAAVTAVQRSEQVKALG